MRPYEQVLLDLDGCLWVGDDAVDGAVEAVAALRAAGKAVAFLTNGAGHAPEEFVRKLWRLGFQAVGGRGRHRRARRCSTRSRPAAAAPRS